MGCIKRKDGVGVLRGNRRSPFTASMMSGSTSPSLSGVGCISASSLSPKQRHNGVKGEKHANSQARMGVRTKATTRGGENYNSAWKKVSREDSRKEQTLSGKRKVNEGKGGGVRGNGKKGHYAEVDVGSTEIDEVAAMV